MDPNFRGGVLSRRDRLAHLSGAEAALRKTWITRGGALVLACLLAGTSGGVAQEQQQEFTPAERRALLAGELVRRNVVRREGHNQLFGGVSFQLVHAPIDRVWRTVTNASLFPRLIPSLDEARVVEEHPTYRLIYMHHSAAMVSTAYHVRMHVDDATHSLRFDLDQSHPHDMRAGRGFLSLTPYRGGTIVSWGMLADVGGGAIMQLFAPFLNDWLLKPPRCVRDEVEPGRENTC
jgi:hypothetical protein